MRQRPIGGLAAFVTLPQLDCEQNGETRSNELVSAIAHFGQALCSSAEGACHHDRLW
jgi:hypothetical protein